MVQEIDQDQDFETAIAEAREAVRPNTAMFRTAKWANEIIGSLNKFINSNNYEFIGLKLFRDRCLAESDYEWITHNKETGDSFNEFTRRYMAKIAINHAIGNGVFLPYKVSNPYNTKFKTTAIRLNTYHRAVKAYYSRYQEMFDEKDDETTD